MNLAKQAGITQKTAWHILTRLRDASKQNTGIFSSAVEVDETFVGSKEKNKHVSKKQGSRARYHSKLP